jgi:hypothetical protein
MNIKIKGWRKVSSIELHFLGIGYFKEQWIYVMNQKVIKSAGN